MEKIETINQRLQDLFGCPYDNKPEWRVVWSETQFETRYGTFEKISASGVWLGVETGYKLVPKYRQWMPNQWVLERITPVPENSGLTSKLSYEPVYGFKGLDVDWEIIETLIHTIYAAMSKHDKKYAKYKMPESEYQNAEGIEERVRKLQKVLFEDESTLTKALQLREAVTVPAAIVNNEVVK